MAETRDIDVPISRVLVIYTGGTIGMADLGKGYEPIPGWMDGYLRGLDMFHDAKFYDSKAHGPGLITGLSKFGKRVYYEIMEYDPVLDSSNMSMSDWARIARDIDTHYSNWDAFVIMHGTDTMAYTSSALSFMLENLGKTVVITGSQVPMSEQRNDGCANFQGALLVAGHYVIPEVCLFFDNKLLRGNRASKVHATQLSAFDSPNLPPLMKLGIAIDVAWDALFRSSTVAKFCVQTSMEPNVAVLRLFPGITASTIRNICAPPTRGVVLLSFGAGNAPEREDILGAFKDAADRGILIVNCTQCHGGYVEAAYAAGQTLLAAGVYSGADMTPEAALTKLSYLLGNDRLTNEQRVRMLTTNIRGEQMVGNSSKQFSLQDASFIESVARAMGTSSSKEVGLLRSALAPVLLCSAARTGDVKFMESLVADGCDPCLADYDGRTPLHLASAEGHCAMIRALLDRGAPVHAVDRFGYSALRDAVEAGHADAIRMLVEVGATLHMDNHNLGGVLCNLAADDKLEKLEHWSRAGADLNAADYDGRTALHVACAKGSEKVARFLVSATGVDIAATDAFGRTPADEAAANAPPLSPLFN